jgi:hypothetical protein
VLAPFVPAVGFLLALAGLLWTTPVGGPAFEPALLPSRIPLEVAGVDPLVAVASVGIGQSRLYLTTVSALLLVLGTIAALVGDRGGSLAGAGLGGGAAGSLVHVSGCHCAAGATTYLWQLAA